MKDFFLRYKFAKAWQLADSLISRGLTGATVSEEIKDIREISCHGSSEIGISPCEKREPSKKHPNSFICTGCGCGDFRHTQLSNIGDGHYSKLDYPRVHCPKQMPGFSNYTPLTISENNERKKLMEDTFGVDYLSRLLKENEK